MLEKLEADIEALRSEIEGCDARKRAIEEELINIDRAKAQAEVKADYAQELREHCLVLEKSASELRRAGKAMRPYRLKRPLRSKKKRLPKAQTAKPREAQKAGLLG